VCEACNNAIEHAYPASAATFTVEISRADGDAVIVVRDTGTWRPARPGVDGRGLLLMRALMDTVEIDRAASGTTVRLRGRLSAGIRA
jgi:serine/threonine-protein kinase RsbW